MPARNSSKRTGVRVYKARDLMGFRMGWNGQNASSEYFGIREGLFRPSIKVDTSALDTISRNMEHAVAMEMWRLGRLARDMARKKAPFQSGALRAGIYVTQPMNKLELGHLRSGDAARKQKIKLGRHTGSYYRTISRIHAKTYTNMPGETADDTLNRLIITNTQRPRGKITRQDFDDEFGVEGSDDQNYAAVARALPYNPIGTTGRTAFFVGIGSAMYYSAWVEYGTSKMKGRYFFTPAANWLVNEAPKALSRVLRAQGASAKRTRAVRAGVG